LSAFLREKGIWFRANYLLKYSTYFKTGGEARYYIAPQEVSHLSELINTLNRLEIPYRVIGLTSNILFLDEVDYGVIVTTSNLNNVVIDGDTMSVGAGYPLQDMVRVATINGAFGFDGLEGIPGTVGGGIFMNASAYGSCISDQLVSVDCIDSAGSVISLSKAECAFQYRDSIFRHNSMVVVGGRFTLQKADRQKSYDNIEAVHIARHSYQEYVYPNLGSMISYPGNIYEWIFRNDIGYRLIFKFLKLSLKNPVVKFIQRRRPRNSIFNSLLRRFLIKKLGTSSKEYSISAKSANILINDGTKDIIEQIYYLATISDMVGDQFRVENEIVLDPAEFLKSNFSESYFKLKEVIAKFQRK
jgi:UDP-N-acetylmuramate dehydrogenase